MSEIRSVSIPTALNIIANRYKISYSKAVQEGILLLLHKEKNFPADDAELAYFGKGKYIEFKKEIAESLFKSNIREPQ